MFRARVRSNLGTGDHGPRLSVCDARAGLERKTVGGETGARTWMSWYEMVAACRARPSNAIRRTFTNTSAAVPPTASKAAPSTAWTPCTQPASLSALPSCSTYTC